MTQFRVPDGFTTFADSEEHVHLLEGGAFDVEMRSDVLTMPSFDIKWANGLDGSSVPRALYVSRGGRCWERMVNEDFKSM